MFHLTNFIAIFSWLILIVKICKVLLATGLDLLDHCLRLFLDLKKKLLKRKVTDTETAKSEQSINQEIRIFTKKAIYNISHDHTFSCLWYEESYLFDVLTKKQAQSIYDTLNSKYKIAKEKSDKRKKKMRDKIVFWVNFSKAIIKWVMYVAYIGIGLGAVYMAFSCFWPVVGFFSYIFDWIFSIDLASVIWVLVIGFKVTLIGVGIALLMGFIVRYKVVQKSCSSCVEGVIFCLPPIVLIFDLLFAPIKWIRGGFVNVYDFVSVFYEENCPPINIISEEDEQLERTLEDI